MHFCWKSLWHAPNLRIAGLQPLLSKDWSFWSFLKNCIFVFKIFLFFLLCCFFLREKFSFPSRPSTFWTKRYIFWYLDQKWTFYIDDYCIPLGRRAFPFVKSAFSSCFSPKKGCQLGAKCRFHKNWQWQTTLLRKWPSLISLKIHSFLNLLLPFLLSWLAANEYYRSENVEIRGVPTSLAEKCILERGRMDSTQLLPNALECVRNRCIRLASLHPYWFLAWTRHSYCASGTRSAKRNFFSWWNSLVLASPGMMILVQSLPPAMFKPIPSFCKTKRFQSQKCESTSCLWVHYFVLFILGKPSVSPDENLAN